MPRGPQRPDPENTGDRQPDDETRLGTVAGLVSELSELTSLMLATDALDHVVWEAAMLAVHAIDEVDACGVTVLREGAPLSIMPGTAPYARLEDYQYAHDAGPVLAAMTRRRTVLTTPTEAQHWPEYAALSRQLGVASSLVVPLVVGEQVLGALSLYATSTETDLNSARPLGELVGDLASTALSCMARQAEQTKLTEELQGALTSRAIIEQAKGMLMSARDIHEDDAFALLRRSSQHHNIRLRDVAAIVVDTRAPASYPGASGAAPAASTAQQTRRDHRRR